MKSPALIFDFGNVVAFFDYARACDRVARELKLGVTGRQLLDCIGQADFHKLVVEYEHGRIEDREFGRRLLNLLRLEVSWDLFREAWADIFWLNDGVAQVVEQLDERGYRLVLGSNTNALHSEYYLRRFAEVLGRFDEVVLSHRIGLMKPDPGFYVECVKACGLPARECVFVDDLAENVEGAKRVGLKGIQYVRDTARLIEQLREEGVEI